MEKITVENRINTPSHKCIPVKTAVYSVFVFSMTSISNMFQDPRLLMSDKKYLASNGVLDRKYVLGYTNAEGLGGMDGFVHKADAGKLWRF